MTFGVRTFWVQGEYQDNPNIALRLTIAFCFSTTDLGGLHVFSVITKAQYPCHYYSKASSLNIFKRTYSMADASYRAVFGQKHLFHT